MGRIFDNQIPYYGMRIAVSSPRIDPETKARLFWRLYERAEVGFVRRYLRTDLDVVELGSSIGVMACIITSLLPDTKRLLTVEADPELAAVLKLNLESNFKTRSAIVINKAVSYSGLEKPALCRHETSVGGTISPSAARASGSITVGAASLSALIREAGFAAYALVCDIEGSEAGILFHDTQALDLCQQIIIELHSLRLNDLAYTVEDLSARILSLGFYRVDHHGPVHVFARGQSSRVPARPGGQTGELSP